MAQQVIGGEEEGYLYQESEGCPEGAGRSVALKPMGGLYHAVALLPGEVFLDVGEASLHPLLHSLLLPLPHLGDVEEREHDYGHAQGQEYDGETVAPSKLHITCEQEAQNRLYRLDDEEIDKFH